MIRRTLGGVLTIAGGFCIYLFATRSLFGQDLSGASYDPGRPFATLGTQYPADVFLLLGAVWSFLIGLYLILTAEPRPAERGPRGGRISRIMLMNSLLLVSTLFVGYIGARGNQEASLLAVFGLIALAQVALGLILLILSFFERPKGIISLFLGTAVYLVGTGIGLLAFFWGGQGA